MNEYRKAIIETIKFIENEKMLRDVYEYAKNMRCIYEKVRMYDYPINDTEQMF